MAAPMQESDAARAAAYPVIPKDTWWRLRKTFKVKGEPKPTFNEQYLINTGVRESKPSANNLVRPFKRIRLFTEDGKPTDTYWDWINDAKYSAACKQILHAVYPVEVTSVFTSTEEDEQERLEGWFRRTLGVAPKSARQYASFYMLLLKADVKEQDEVAPQKPPKASKAGGTRPNNQSGRSTGANGQAISPARQEPHASESEVVNQSDGHDSERHHATGRSAHSIEPSLNINVQIHIPAEATPDQIDQIFKSMAKHLYQRHDEVGE